MGDVRQELYLIADEMRGMTSGYQNVARSGETYFDFRPRTVRRPRDADAPAARRRIMWYRAGK